jgi:imidazolonepropionase-like amidohydrolase
LPDPHVTFREVTVFDGSSFREGLTVIIGSGAVAAVGDSAEIDVALESEAISGSGRTLLPGFIDAHIHVGFYDARVILAGGITSARDLGWPPEQIFRLVDELRNMTDTGPLLLAAGPMLTARGGYPSRADWAPRGTALEVRDEEDARNAVRSLVAEGAAIIKVAQDPRAGPVLERDVLKAIVEEAHSAGLRVTSHLGSLEQLEVALDAGVDELAHGLWSDEEIPPAVMDRMVAQQMTVIPTLHIDPSEIRIKNLRRFHEAGGKVVYGTDMGNTGPPPGIDPSELSLMREAGMSVEEVLASATSLAAEHLGLSGRGAIEVGARADLILVDGDPRDDFRVLANPIKVIRSG